MSSRPAVLESFPAYSLSSDEPTTQKFTLEQTIRRRRKSSTLGGDPRGDSGAGSLATAFPPRPASSASDSPTTPASTSVSERHGRERGRKRKHAKTLLKRWKRLSLRHTWLNPLIIVLAVLGGYFVSPGKHNPLRHAIYLSYPNPPEYQRTRLPKHVGEVTQYGKGSFDFVFVAFYTVVMTFFREFIMQRILRPTAISLGFTQRNRQSRFMEQSFTAIYHGAVSVFGLFVMSRTSIWWFNIDGMLEEYPHRANESYFKAFYLLQASYWTMLGLVLLLQLEKPRKDYKELVLHHVVTLSLIWSSYRYHFTYMGIAVFITHDVSDFFLATSKVLNYMNSPIVPPYYVMFMCVWVYTRHYINLRLLFSVMPAGHIPFTNIETGQFSTVGPYGINWETHQYKGQLASCIAFTLMGALQAVNIFWFVLIIRILLRFANGIVKDERSDDEEEEEEEVIAKADDQKTNGRVTKSEPNMTINGKPVTANGSAKHAANGSNGHVTKRKA